MQFERFTLYPAKHGSNLLGDVVINIADEAQSQVVIFRVDPTRPRQTTAQCRRGLSDIGGNFDTGEQTWHRATSSYEPRAVRAREINSSTRGRIRATITSTPAALGCRPSPWFNFASVATPSRKNG